MNKKILIGSIIAVAILVLVSSSSAVVVSNNVNNDLPDLVPWRLSIYPHYPGGPPDYIDLFVENRGNAPAIGNFTVNFSIVKMILWLFPLRTIYEDNCIRATRDEGIPPGDWDPFFLAMCYEVPAKFGFLRFNIEINSGRTIEESNYDNNKGSVIYFYFFGYYLW